MKKFLLIATFFFAYGANAQLRLVKNINPNSNSSPGSLFEYNGRLYFSAIQTIAGQRLIFATDGTENGTVNITYDDITPGLNAQNPFGTVLFYNYNSELYFDARKSPTDPMNVVKLIANTNTATPIYNMSTASSSNLSRFAFAKGLQNKIVYNPIASGNSIGVEPFVVNLATPTSSGLLKDIYSPPINNSSSPENFTVFNDTIYFSARNATLGREIWKTDGTPAKTLPYYDVNGGVNSSDPDNFNVLGNQLTFVATHGVQGRELFKTNGLGTIANIKDINPGIGNSNPTDVSNIDGKLYFSADNGTVGQELWVSDGTNAGTFLLKDINPTGGSFPTNFKKMGSYIYFVANSTEIWKTDGTSLGTALVKIVSTNTSASIEKFVAYNNKLYFLFNNGGNELWACDGSALGTQMILAATYFPDEIYLFNNELFMYAKFNALTGFELCAYSDPTLSTNNFSSSDKEVTLFPNPSRTYFELATSHIIEKVEIYSMLGQLVKTFEKQDQYSISDLEMGSYIVKIKTSVGSSNKTLIVE